MSNLSLSFLPVAVSTVWRVAYKLTNIEIMKHCPLEDAMIYRSRRCNLKTLLLVKNNTVYQKNNEGEEK